MNNKKKELFDKLTREEAPQDHMRNVRQAVYPEMEKQARGFSVWGLLLKASPVVGVAAALLIVIQLQNKDSETVTPDTTQVAMENRAEIEQQAEEVKQVEKPKVVEKSDAEVLQVAQKMKPVLLRRADMMAKLPLLQDLDVLLKWDGKVATGRPWYKNIEVFPEAHAADEDWEEMTEDQFQRFIQKPKMLVKKKPGVSPAQLAKIKALGKPMADQERIQAYRKFEKLDAEDQQLALQNFKHWNHFSAVKKLLVEQRFEKWNALSEYDQELVKVKYAQWEQLTEGQRNKIRKKYRKA